MVRRVKDEQTSFDFAGWGGKRDGAGRPRKVGARLRHAARLPLASRYPVHVTHRTVSGAPNLRRSASYEVIEEAIRAVRARDGFRVVHFTSSRTTCTRSSRHMTPMRCPEACRRSASASRAA
jgi:hypothetical protein